MGKPGLHESQQGKGRTAEKTGAQGAAVGGIPAL
nr:MAG TPA: hypothetical protein [Caudoviricetes sp.]